MARGRRLAQHVPARTAWPILNVWEPMSGDFGVLQPAQLSQIAIEDQYFFNLYKDGLHCGQFNTERWKEWCDKTGVPFTPWHETSGVVEGQTLIPLDVLSNLCEDLVPHIGAFLDDLLWGGFEGSTILGGAIASTLPLLKHGQCVLSKIHDYRPKISPLSYHRSLTSHHRAPTMIWKKIEGTLQPLLPLARQYRIDSVVDYDMLPNSFVAKIIRINQQWKAHFILPVDDTESLVRVLHSRLLLAWFRYRRHSHNICFEDILRERSDILYRTAVELKY